LPDFFVFFCSVYGGEGGVEGFFYFFGVAVYGEADGDCVGFFVDSRLDVFFAFF